MLLTIYNLRTSIPVDHGSYYEVRYVSLRVLFDLAPCLLPPYAIVLSQPPSSASMKSMNTHAIVSNTQEYQTKTHRGAHNRYNPGQKETKNQMSSKLTKK